MRLVQRRQWRERVQLLEDFGRESDRCGEVPSAMHNAVPYRRECIRLHVFLGPGQQRTQHGVVSCILPPPVLVRQRRPSRIGRGEVRVATDALVWAHLIPEIAPLDRPGGSLSPKERTRDSRVQYTRLEHRPHIFPETAQYYALVSDS
jgi:hypothetical protein